MAHYADANEMAKSNLFENDTRGEGGNNTREKSNS